MTMGSLSAGISAQRVRGGAGPALHIVMTSSVRYGGFMLSSTACWFPEEPS